MKNIYLFLFSLILLASCQESYELSDKFSVPTAFHNPTSVQIDLTSTQNVILSWEGGKANDGGVLLYNVKFDKADGDFSVPVYKTVSDMGANSQLTLTHVMLNKIARTSGIKIGETATLKWTVEASRGGITRNAEGNGTITLTRPTKEIPEKLYLLGTATENGGTNGMELRVQSDGIFVIYTKLSNGNILFADGTTPDAIHYTIDANEKLVEGNEGSATTGYDNPIRMTVNFNTKEIKIDQISGIRMIWGATFGVIANLNYTKNGIFNSNQVKVLFIDPNRPETNPPSWLSWIEERYYFIATVNEKEVCWGRMDGVSSERPSDNESVKFFEIGEFAWGQWDHLWKMHGNLDNKTCIVTINTNLEGMMVHQFSNIK